MSLIGQKITVVGGGIGGLVAALAMAMRGAQVTILEQAEEIGEVGAGLQISPNGVAVLRALGLGHALEEAGMRATAVDLIDGIGGHPVIRLDLAGLKPASPYYFLHRADLIEMLARAARDAGVHIRLLQKIEGVRLGADHPPQVTTAQGAEIEAPLLIGADGLHSKVRQALNGKVAPFFTHQVAWRALVPCDRTAAPVAQVFMGPNRHIVSYPLRGGRLRNIVAVEERHRWAEESWSATDDPIALQTAFEDFAQPVRRWLESVERVNIWGLFRHPVAERWHGNGAALLGDAAHPTLPFLAQGANMALEDAWVLTAMLDEHAEPAVALAAYQAARRDRTVRIVAAANANARNYHLKGPKKLIGHLGLKIGGVLAPKFALSRFDWLYDYDVTTQTPDC